MSRDLCRRIEEQVTELATPSLGDPPSAAGSELTRHALACATCALLLRRERALQARLAAWPDAPPRDLLPPLPGPGTLAPAGRTLRFDFVRAACAAAVLAVVVWSAYPRSAPGAGSQGESGSLPADAHADARVDVAFRILDDTSPFPGWDERLLGLAAGAEQMASLRPAETR